MICSQAHIRELIAWGLDSGVDRGSASLPPNEAIHVVAEKARRALQMRSPMQQSCPLLQRETKEIATLLHEQRKRADLMREFERFDWELYVVDLHKLLAFQRRLLFHEGRVSHAVESADWQQLVALAFPEQRLGDVVWSANAAGSEVIIRSGNPDLQVKIGPPASPDTLCIPVWIDHGSPFLEVAEYNGRWFLRDGYHRAYALLAAEIFRVPAVVIRARTLDELGAVHPWFFDEKALFSERPPQLIDFHDHNLAVSYKRPTQEKVIRISIEESFHASTTQNTEGAER